jgi:hypothetical protein
MKRKGMQNKGICFRGYDITQSKCPVQTICRMLQFELDADTQDLMKRSEP